MEGGAAAPSWSSTGSARWSACWWTPTAPWRGRPRVTVSRRRCCRWPSAARCCGGRPTRLAMLGRPERADGAARGARWARRPRPRPCSSLTGAPTHPGRLALGTVAGGVRAGPGGGRAGAVGRGGGADPEREDHRPGRAGDPGLGRPGGGGQRQERPSASHPANGATDGARSGASIPPVRPGHATSTWSPLTACAAWPGARRMAADLAETAKADGTTADGEFWYATAAKLLAPLLFAAARDGRLHGRRGALGRHPGGERGVRTSSRQAGVPEALEAARASWCRDERTRSSVYTTAETILAPFAAPGGPAGGPRSSRATCSAGRHTAVPLRAGARPASAARLLHRADPAGARPRVRAGHPVGQAAGPTAARRAR